jgi:hypothetical protein
VLKADEEHYEYFKNEGNLEILMTFVIDPTFYRPCLKWKETYPELDHTPMFKDVRAYKLHQHEYI